MINRELFFKANAAVLQADALRIRRKAREMLRQPVIPREELEAMLFAAAQQLDFAGNMLIHATERPATETRTIAQGR